MMEQKGESPLFTEGISLSRKGVLITAFKNEVDGKLLRLWEQAGKSGLCIVSLEGSSFKKAYPCNLLGEIIDVKGIEILENSFQFIIKPNQPISFILK